MRHVASASLFLLLLGCTLPPERVPLRPLPDDGTPLTYSDLIQRARLQASAANDAFYVNKWTDLEDVAKNLEQTARYLAKSTDVPARHKDNLAVHSTDLGKEADKLLESVKARDVKLTNESLQRLHLKVRELRPDN